MRSKSQRPSYNPRQLGCRCDVCPLNNQTPVLPDGPPDPDLIIIMERPDYHEMKSGIPASGPTGTLLKSLLQEAGSSRAKAWVTNLIMCPSQVPGTDSSEERDLKVYVAWLRKENANRRKRGEHTVADPRDCCRPHIDGAIAHFDRLAHERGEPNGVVVVPASALAAQALTGLTQGIHKLRGSVNFPSQLAGVSPDDQK